MKRSFEVNSVSSKSILGSNKLIQASKKKIKLSQDVTQTTSKLSLDEENEIEAAIF